MHLTHHHNNMMTVLEASSSTTSWHHQPTMAASKSKQVKPSIPHVENKEEEQSLDGYKRGLFCDDRDMTCIMMFNIIYGLGVWVVGENAQEGFGVFIFGLPPVLEPDFDLLWLNVGQHRRLTDELLSSDGAGLGTLMIHPLQCLHLLVCVPHILPRGIHPTTSPLPFWSSPSSFSAASSSSLSLSLKNPPTHYTPLEKNYFPALSPSSKPSSNTSPAVPQAAGHQLRAQQTRLLLLLLSSHNHHQEENGHALKCTWAPCNAMLEP
jgi:hypothetical protein